MAALWFLKEYGDETIGQSAVRPAHSKLLPAREVRVVELLVDAIVVHYFLHVGFSFVEAHF